MEAFLTERELKRYFRRRKTNGRGAFARAFDAGALTLLLWAAAFLLYRPTFPPTAALLLALVTAAMLTVLLAMREARRLRRFTGKETERIRRTLLADRLSLLSASEAIQLTAPLCGEGETPLPLFTEGRATADMLLCALKRHLPHETLAVFTLAGCDEAAVALSRRLPDRLRLYAQEPLYRAAARTPLCPGEKEIHAYIRAELAAGKRRRAAARANTFLPGGTRRYLLCALLLIGVSFVSRYALYCRALAGLAGMLGAVSAALGRAPKRGETT